MLSTINSYCRVILISVFFVIIMSSPLFSSDGVIIRDGQERIELFKKYDYLVDKKNSLGIKDILSPDYAKRFSKPNKPFPHYGYTQDTYWVHARIQNVSGRERWYLEIQSPSIDTAKIYLVHNGVVLKEMKAGWKVNLREWSYPYRFPLFPINFKNKQTTDIYLRVSTRNNMRFPMVLWKPRVFQHAVNKESVLIGTLLGLVIFAMLYNTFTYFRLKDKNYLYFLMIVFFYGLFVIEFYGLRFLYLTSIHISYYNILISIYLGMIALFFNIFTRSFLDTKSISPVLDKILLFLFIPLTIQLVLSFSGQAAFANTLFFIYFFLLGFILTPLAILLNKKKVFISKFYLISWLSLPIGIGLLFLRNMGLIPFSILSLNSPHIGAIIQVSLLSIALSDKIKAVEKERDLAQRQAIENLHKADHLKDEFLANTSHELKSPLNGIIGLSESMIDGVAGVLNDHQKSILNMVIRSGKRLSNLVNDILDYSLLKHKNIVLQKKHIPLKPLVDMVIQISEPLLYNKSVRLVNLVSDRELYIYADENRLQQILHNLINNAIKYTEEGIIEISANISGEMVEISVKDTGIGISEEKLDLIFESFQQGDSGIARLYGGTGLGLTISKTLVELHGGSISVQSSKGQGSHFYFTVPQGEITDEPMISDESVAVISHQPSTESPLETSIIQSSDGRRGNILAVDDDPVNLQVLVNYLSMEKYTVVTAMNGQDALNLVNNQSFDIVLLDIMMPRMSGYEVCTHIRQFYSAIELPIILLTAKNQLTDLVMGLECGANDYLTKPFTRGELIARMKNHLNISYYYNQLKELNNRLNHSVQERIRITARIHNSLKNKLEAARGHLHNQIRKPEKYNNLQLIENLLTHCTRESGNILFVLNNSECTVEKLLDEIKLHTELMFKIYNISFSVTPDKLYIKDVLDMEKVHGILDIYLEILNNIIKHSSANHVDIQASYENDILSISVKDNGIGFDYHNARRKHISYGLNIIDDLALQIGGKYRYNSAINQGTEFYLTVKECHKAPSKILFI